MFNKMTIFAMIMSCYFVTSNNIVNSIKKDISPYDTNDTVSLAYQVMDAYVNFDRVIKESDEMFNTSQSMLDAFNGVLNVTHYMGIQAKVYGDRDSYNKEDFARLIKDFEITIGVALVY